ncbi:MAG TPA: hypothetical protein VND70_03285 [Acidimicrobiales bacterium]|nr:hypothetical protein [Acidimicrobiales bacterium]
MKLAELKREGAPSAQRSDSLRELNPWREVGWIFKDGESVAIERHGDEIRVRTLVD